LVMPGRVVDHLRTYGDPVRAATAAARERRTALGRVDGLPVAVWGHLGPAGGQLVRAEPLTPYAAQTIAEDALRAGPGARLEITVPEDASDSDLTGVRAEFAWLADHGLALRIGRAHRPDAPSSAAA